MYAPSYGFGPGTNNSQPFNPNGTPHNPHQQQQQPPGQPQMMYNPQQYAGAGPPQSPYGGGPGPGMGPNAGGMGMMQNSGLAHMAGGHGMFVPSSRFNLDCFSALGLVHARCYMRLASLQAQRTGRVRSSTRRQPMLKSINTSLRRIRQTSLTRLLSSVASYQTPYSSSPYGASIPTSAAANFPPNVMPTTSGGPSFAQSAPNMNPQQMQAQRMQPPPQVSTPTQPGQRASPYGSMPHKTPPNSSNAQSQFSTPQTSIQTNVQTNVQTPNNNQQNQGGTVVTPQSATFPAVSHGTGAGMATPLSPGSEVREKDRVTLLLEINRELLLEVMRLQAAQLAEKAGVEKEETAASSTPPASTGDKDKEKEKAKTVSSREYFECMRRLQGNLAYLAAIADRSHKPSSQIPAHPAVMSAPPLGPRSKKDPVSSPSIETKIGNVDEDKKPENTESPEDSENRAETLKDQYKRLQALFPGVDPKHDTQAQSANAAARAQAQAKQKQAQAQAQAQTLAGHSQGGEQTPQQKIQTDLYRQHMIQQAQQQAAAAQQNQQNQSQNHGQNR
ncbi:hypothetical protein D0Z07_4433 [Hyphodiscus hymeniophilus]|uniref:Uncharacterized protein n=1 Tax=Hyphodiscus hymeniophilus TaxID=353542 RepID=A0A9P7AX73_9HELO|nr:hypothetical protein D0Z07_4433 [Hyphodiscus hymeniophilus]